MGFGRFHMESPISVIRPLFVLSLPRDVTIFYRTLTELEKTDSLTFFFIGPYIGLFFGPRSGSRASDASLDDVFNQLQAQKSRSERKGKSLLNC